MFCFPCFILTLLSSNTISSLCLYLLCFAVYITLLYRFPLRDNTLFCFLFRLRTCPRATLQSRPDLTLLGFKEIVGSRAKTSGEYD